MLNRDDIITRFAQKGYTKKDAELVIDDVIRVISEALVEGEAIRFYGFGTFSVRESAPKNTINYQTKERMVVPGHKAPRFTPGKLLKRAVREGILRE